MNAIQCGDGGVVSLPSRWGGSGNETKSRAWKYDGSKRTTGWASLHQGQDESAAAYSMFVETDNRTHRPTYILLTQMEFAVRMTCQSCVDAVKKSLENVQGTFERNSSNAHR